MKVRRLTILRMPGFEYDDKRRPTYDDLSGGCNLIVGGNGSGKTTTALAIRCLLWPEGIEDRRIRLTSEWESARGSLRLEIDGRDRLAQLDGNDCAYPVMPVDATLADCYTITVDNLFITGAADRELAGRVSREMAGGVDVAAVIEQDPFKHKRSRGRDEARRAREARGELHRLAGEQKQLQQSKDILPELRRRCTEAKQAARSLDQLKIALDLHEKDRELGALEGSLAAFDPAMEKLTGAESRMLESIEKDIAAARGQLGDAVQRLSVARARREACGFEKGVPPDENTLEAHRNRVRLAQEQEGIIRQIEADLAGDRQRLAAAEKSLAELGDPRRLTELDSDGLDRIDDLHRESSRKEAEFEKLRAEHGLLKSQIDGLNAGRAGSDLEEATRLLREWLRLPVGARVSRDSIRLWLVPLGAAAVSLVAIFLAARSLLFLLLLLPAALVLFGWFASRSADLPDDRRRAQIESECRRLACVGLRHFDVAGAQDLLRKLEQEKDRLEATAGQVRVKQEMLEGISTRIERVEKEVADCKRRWQGMGLGLGADEERSPAALVLLADGLRDYRKVQADVSARQGALDQRNAQLAEMIGPVCSFLQGHGYAECPDASRAMVHAEDIARQASVYHLANKDIVEAQKQADHQEGYIAELQERLAELYRDAGVEVGNQRELRSRFEKIDEYQQNRQALHDARTTRKALAVRFEGDPGWLEMPSSELDAQRQDLENQANQHDEYLKKIQSLEDQIDAAGREQVVELALESYRQAIESLREAGESEIFAVAGRFLLDRAKATYVRESRPEILDRADKLFSLFTLGRLSLGFDEDSSQFRAFDETKRVGKGIDALSRGEKTQLLLAIRVAFAQHEEKGARLPLVLDEALIESDPERFRAIATSMLRLSTKEGRQVFYLTSRPGDALAWSQIASAEGLGETKTFNLDELAVHRRSLAAPLSAALPPVPSPNGMSMTDYAILLAAPAFDPVEPVGTLHLCHLLENPESLYDLLRIGIREWGQLRRLMKSADIEKKFLTRENISRVLAKAELYEQVATVWATGRGKPLSAEVICEAGMISVTFENRVVKRARKLGNDARTLIASLRDEPFKRFNQEYTDRLEEYLIEHGYIDNRPLLSPRDSVTQVVSSMSERLAAGLLSEDLLREITTSVFGT
ncbi:MAG TPA: hypothetical protein VM425_08240 [Myxococcota bacterium]|nr:hypothetical protein [Myxococcota bacterium]